MPCSIPILENNQPLVESKFIVDVAEANIGYVTPSITVWNVVPLSIVKGSGLLLES